MGLQESSVGEIMSFNTDGWALKPNEWTDDLYRVIRRFLICSLAYDTTQMASSFMEALNIHGSAVAEQFLKEIEKRFGFEIDFCESAKEVEEKTSGYGEKPWDFKGCYFICVRSEKDSLTRVVKQTTDYADSASNRLEKGANEVILRRFYEVDAIYRHLRNGLAHGCFRVLCEKTDPRLFVFDVNQYGTLSACILLSFFHLDDLYELACSVAKRKL